MSRKYASGIIAMVLSATLFNCIPNKKIVYLQDLADTSAVSKSGKLVPYDIDGYRLQCNDVVDVTMKTTSTELNQILNVNESDVQLRNLGGLNGGDAFFLNGYTIDDDGIVDLPLIGEIKLVGMTMKEAKEAVEVRLKEFVTEGNYFVRLRLGGIRYSALGEFNKPGKFTILQNRVTIYEAIANAGDMTSLAKKTDVLLIRQYPDGAKTHSINLLSNKIMESEFFFIRPNDMIYAQPMKVKQLGTGITASQSLQLMLSVLTVVLLFINVTN
jgi:polysaccharide export outer membrane protein